MNSLLKSSLSLLGLFVTLSSFSGKEERAKSSFTNTCDSATISFFNSSKTELKYVHAVIKEKEVGFLNLKAGSESPAFKVCITARDHFRFSVFKDDLEDKQSIEPMDYFEQVSTDTIGKGTYVYDIGYDKYGLLHISLKKKDR